MKKIDPLGTSTPKDLNFGKSDRVQGRETYHKERSPSPIAEDEHSTSAEENEIESVENEVRHRYRREYRPIGNNSASDKPHNNAFTRMTIISVVVVLFITIAVLPTFSFNSSEIINIEDLKKTFPSQSEDLWHAIISGVPEIVNYNRPTVLFLLHQRNDKKTIDHFLNKLTKYVSCIVNQDCKIDPIILTSQALSSPKLMADYGHLLVTYKSQLEKTATMVVRDVDLVPGKVAQAFHSICDQYTPLVPKSMIIFTMGVDEFSANNVQLVENVLQNNWGNLDIDVYIPLITRMTNLVLRIESEQLKKEK